MKLHFPFPRHNKTAFIQIDLNQCQACWNCVAACPHQVLGKIEFVGHQHVHVDNAENCKGCKACVRACPTNAIRYTYVPTAKTKAPII